MLTRMFPKTAKVLRLISKKTFFTASSVQGREHSMTSFIQLFKELNRSLYSQPKGKSRQNVEITGMRMR
ncbi:MAG: hypothetical protein EPO11_09470 [Gammaproteobacteria bacterium]|nr:MAG: hypothetical protein EPO11_09470 [Gammaproteobacteria bacterium]